MAYDLHPVAEVEAGTYELSGPDLSEIGDVDGQHLVYLQCNAGADTLRGLGGGHGHGVDFSEAAITEARCLAAATGIDATFVCADLYALPDDLGTFEVAYSSMGVLWWLPDLDR